MCGLCIDVCTSRRYSCKFASSVFSTPVQSLLHCRLWNACSEKWSHNLLVLHDLCFHLPTS